MTPARMCQTEVAPGPHSSGDQKRSRTCKSTSTEWHPKREPAPRSDVQSKGRKDWGRQEGPQHLGTMPADRPADTPR